MKVVADIRPPVGTQSKTSPAHIAEHISALGLCMHLLLHCPLCLGCSLCVEPLSLFVLHAAEHTVCVSHLGCAPLQEALFAGSVMRWQFPTLPELLQMTYTFPLRLTILQGNSMNVPTTQGTCVLTYTSSLLTCRLRITFEQLI